MNMQEVYYDSGNGHRLRVLDRRPDGRYVYDDLDRPGTRVICACDQVDGYPRRAAQPSPEYAPWPAPTPEQVQSMKAMRDHRPMVMLDLQMIGRGLRKSIPIEIIDINM